MTKEGRLGLELQAGVEDGEVVQPGLEDHRDQTGRRPGGIVNSRGAVGLVGVGLGRGAVQYAVASIPDGRLKVEAGSGKGVAGLDEGDVGPAALGGLDVLPGGIEFGRQPLGVGCAQRVAGLDGLSLLLQGGNETPVWVRQVVVRWDARHGVERRFSGDLFPRPMYAKPLPLQGASQR